MGKHLTGDPRCELSYASLADTVDFMTGPLMLRAGTWQTRAPAPAGDYKNAGYGPQFTFKQFDQVVETLDLVGYDTSENLREAVNALEYMLELARLWHADPLQYYPVWFTVAAAGEDVRRCLVYGGAVQVLSTLATSPFLSDGTGGITVRLTLTRHPFWETPDIETVDTGVVALYPLSLTGGGVNYNLEYPTLAPARLAMVRFYAPTAALDRIWLGIGEAYTGLEANFNALWECEDGSLGTDAETADDAGASGGSYVSVPFTTPELALRLTITPAQAMDVPEACVGKYLILCRCKVAAGVTAGLTLYQGQSATTGIPVAETVYVENTDWRLIELGEFTLPPEGWKDAGPDLGYFLSQIRLQIWAELLAGSGSLALDSLILMPARHMVKLTRPTNYDSNTYPVAVLTRADDVQIGYGYVSDALPGSPFETVFRDFYFPASSGMLVIAAEQNAAHDLAATCQIELSIYARYPTYTFSEAGTLAPLPLGKIQ